MIRSTHLECTRGAFKEYNIAILAVSEGLYDVPFTFGPLGSPTQGGKLNKSGPVTLVQAETLFDKQRRAKLAKDYDDTGSGNATLLTEVSKERTDWLPQLCNDADPEDLERLLASPNTCLEQKYDGKRIQIVKGYDGETHGINRKGEKVGLPQEIADRVDSIEGQVHLDGELVGIESIVWDVLRRNARDYMVSGAPLSERRDVLEGLSREYPGAFVLARHTVRYKSDMFEQLRREKAEGGVFKLLDAPYRMGRPNKGGDWLRHKFWKTASCRVLGPDPKGKRSVLLALYDGAEWQSAGKVTVPPDFEMPRAHSVVECRYLYARKASGCLYQPVYLGERDDIDIAACQQSQLKFKQGDEDEEES